MEAHDVRAALDALAELRITPGMSEEDAARSMRFFAPFNQCTLGVVRFSGQTPWERHSEGDELLHVLEGEVGVTLLAEAGPLDATLRAGCVFVVPRGLWHRQRAQRVATLLFATPTEKTENSWAEDPRRES